MSSSASPDDTLARANQLIRRGDNFFLPPAERLENYRQAAQLLSDAAREGPLGPDATRALAEAHQGAGTMLSRLQGAGAEEHFEAAVDLFEQLPEGPRPDILFALCVAQLADSLAEARSGHALGRYRQARALYERLCQLEPGGGYEKRYTQVCLQEARLLARSGEAGEAGERLRALVAKAGAGYLQAPDDEDRAGWFFQSSRYAAEVWLELGDAAPCADCLEACERVLKAQAGRPPEELQDFHEAHEEVGRVWLGAEQPARALACFVRGAECREQQARSGSDLGALADVAGRYCTLCLFAQEHGARLQAPALGEKGIALFEELARLEPDAAGHREGLANCLQALGQACAALGDEEAAREVGAREVEARRELRALAPQAPEHAQRLGILLGEQGNQAIERGEAEEAVRLLEGSREAFAQAFAQAPGDSGCLRNLAVANTRLGHLHARAGRGITVGNFLVSRHNDYGRHHPYFFGDRPEARRYFEEAIGLRAELWRRHPGEPNCADELADDHELLAMVWQQAGKPVRARACFERGLAVRQECERRAPLDARLAWKLAQSYHFLGETWVRLGDAEQAEQCLFQSLRALRVHASGNDAGPLLAANYHALALVYKLFGPEEKAQAYLEAARAAGGPVAPPDQDDGPRLSLPAGHIRMHFAKGRPGGRRREEGEG